MPVHQFVTSYSYGDAIGNETLAISNFLHQQGEASEIFAQFYHPRFAHMMHQYQEYDRFSSPDNIVIFHFSIGSRITKKFLHLADKKVIIYHNITPYAYFLDYHRVLTRECYKGRMELRSLVGKVDLALGDSDYNRRELEELGFANTGTLPLLMDFGKLASAAAPVLRRLYDDGKINLAYAGKIMSWKKIEEVIKVFALFQRHFQSESRLLLIGEYRGFERYLAALDDLIQRLQVRNVIFTGHIPQEDMVSLLKLSHLYLHLSEHEGFCAPIVECFHLDIPVIAFAAGAVAETMNQGGLLLQEKDFLRIAALLDEVARQGSLREKIVRTQQSALAKYSPEKIGQLLLAYLQRLS